MEHVQWLRQALDWPFLDGLVADAWGWVVERTDEFQRLTVIPVVPFMAIFHTVNALFLLFHFFPSLSPIERFKVQKGVREKGSRVAWMALNVLFNHAVSIAISLSGYDLMKTLKMESGTEHIPPWYMLVLQMVACCQLYDTLFWLAHRFMHIPIMYRWFHVVHHSSHVSMALTQGYFHPVDYLVSLPSVAAPPLLVSNHIITVVLWQTVWILESLNAHTGYNLPLMPDTRPHDHHHSHPHQPGEYGAMWGLMDYCFGTDANYKKYIAGQEERERKRQQQLKKQK